MMSPFFALGRQPQFPRLVPGSALLLILPLVLSGRAQTQAPSVPAGPAAGAQGAAITLDEAVRRAEGNEPIYAAALASRRSAALDKGIARAGLLPNAAWFNQGLYTEPNGSYGQTGQNGTPEPLPKFIANNGVREYFSQAVVNENLGISQVAAVRHADAVEAQAAAELEVSRRGLVAAVTGLFYTSLASDHKVSVAESAHQEAQDFTKLTTQREDAREAAHADVVKAQLTEQQRERDLEDARVAAEKARLELGVLLFPDPRTPYALQAPEPAPLPSKEDVEQAAAKNNPELKSALAGLQMTNSDVEAAWGALLPNAVLNLTYGIDAPQFSANGPDGVRNLGYSASLTVNVPLWDWLASEHKVKQSQIRRQAAQVALTNTQRHLIARLDEAYSEAVVARDQLASLDQSVATAGESLRLTKLRYQGGEATVLEVVDAQTAYVAAENAREDGRVRYETARADLQTLTGTM